MRLSDRGFTLTELLLAVAILAFVLTSLLLVFINCILSNELNRNLTLAYSAIQTKMEELKNTSFDYLFASCPSPRPSGSFCNGDAFDLAGFSSGTAKGKIEITDESANLKRIKIVACFMSRNRLIGNDINNCLSSPVELVTLVAK